jgi:predicted HD phosphohydrolase
MCDIQKGGDMKRIYGTPCAMVIVALSLGLTGAAYAVESGKKEHDKVQANLKRFDQLDFEAYSERKNMQLFKEIHCPDV